MDKSIAEEIIAEKIEMFESGQTEILDLIEAEIKEIRKLYARAPGSLSATDTLIKRHYELLTRFGHTIEKNAACITMLQMTQRATAYRLNKENKNELD